MKNPDHRAGLLRTKKPHRLGSAIYEGGRLIIHFHITGGIQAFSFEQEYMYKDALEREAITSQVLQNCSISDSRHAGLFSICGLALRLRDLYKWEKGLEPWVEKDSSEVLDWIGDKEDEWERLADKNFRKITILDRQYDPFETQTINIVLEPHGLLYGAGYVHSLKPTFFLAVVEEKRDLNGTPVYILGRELARDLFTVPALSQDNCIIVRKESAVLFLWDQIFQIKKSGRKALEFALEDYGLSLREPETLHQNLAKIIDAEIGTYIHHEMGEIKDNAFDRNIWRKIIAAFPHTPVEHLTRAVKDLLADTEENGTLQYIAGERKNASLGFYVAFLDGLKKALFPELKEVFQTFTETNDWQVIEEAVLMGNNRARYYADELIRIYKAGEEDNDMEWAEREIETALLYPLGVIKEKDR